MEPKPVIVSDLCAPKSPRLPYFPGTAEDGPVDFTVVCSSLNEFRATFRGGLLERFAVRHFRDSSLPARFRRYSDLEMDALSYQIGVNEGVRCYNCGETVETHDWFFGVVPYCIAFRPPFSEPFSRLTLPQFVMFQGDVFDVLERYRHTSIDRHTLSEIQAAIAREVSWQWFRERLVGYAPMVTLSQVDSNISVHFGLERA